jgi:hypothetical protein
MKADKDNLYGYNKRLKPFAKPPPCPRQRGILASQRDDKGGSMFVEICFAGQTDERLSIPQTKTGVELYCRLHV